MTATPTILKLKQAGEFAVITVAQAEVLAYGDYPEVEFLGHDLEGNDVALRVPQKSADRQLERLELSLKGVVGKTLKFSRDPNKKDASKPYWGINVVQGSGAAEGNGGAVAAPRAASAAPQSQPAAPNGHELYGKITAWVLREIVPMYEAGGVPMNAEATAACVATLYINATRNGH